jgi:hypothetical protein
MRQETPWFVDEIRAAAAFPSWAKLVEASHCERGPTPNVGLPFAGRMR